MNELIGKVFVKSILVIFTLDYVIVRRAWESANIIVVAHNTVQYMKLCATAPVHIPGTAEPLCCRQWQMFIFWKKFIAYICTTWIATKNPPKNFYIIIKTLKIYIWKLIMAQKVCVVFGFGPGIGAACARRWVNEGFKVAIIAR